MMQSIAAIFFSRKKTLLEHLHILTSFCFTCKKELCQIGLSPGNPHFLTHKRHLNLTKKTLFKQNSQGILYVILENVLKNDGNLSNWQLLWRKWNVFYIDFDHFHWHIFQESLLNTYIFLISDVFILFWKR